MKDKILMVILGVIIAGIWSWSLIYVRDWERTESFNKFHYEMVAIIMMAKDGDAEAKPFCDATEKLYEKHKDNPRIKSRFTSSVQRMQYIRK